MRFPIILSGALAALALTTVPAAAQGRWLSAYPRVKDPQYNVLRDIYVRQDVLGEMLEPLNQDYPVPRDVTLELAECGTPGAFYDPSRATVQMCYEFLMELFESLEGVDEDQLETLFAGAFAVVMLHQVGHAVIDVLDLPVTVPAEEAADQVIAVSAAAKGEDLSLLLEGALLLEELGVDWENPGSGRTALAGERLDRLMCLAYGANPDAYAWVVDEDYLSAGAAAACPREFQRVDEAWTRMVRARTGG